MTMKYRRVLDVTVFLLLSAIWGSSFLFIKFAAEEIPPITLVALRLLMASVTMIIGTSIGCCIAPNFRYTAKVTLQNTSWYWKVFLMGFLNNSIPFTLVAWAESQPSVNVGTASVLDSIIPLFSQLFGHFLLHNERMTLRKSIGLFVGFLGVFGVCAVKIFNLDGKASAGGLKNSTEKNSWESLGYYMMIIIATASYGLASVFGKRTLSDAFNPVVTATGQIISGSIINTFLALVWDYFGPLDDIFNKPEDLHFKFLTHTSSMAWGSLIYLSVVSTCIAYLCYFYLLSSIGSVRQTMVGFMLPVFGVTLGIIVQKEWKDIPWYCKVLEVAGALLIGIGIYFVNFTRNPTQSDEKALLGDHESLVSPTDMDANNVSVKETQPTSYGAVSINA